MDDEMKDPIRLDLFKKGNVSAKVVDGAKSKPVLELLIEKYGDEKGREMYRGLLKGE
nr:hypothetical protein [uncultured Allomuricauda sp.]